MQTSKKLNTQIMKKNSEYYIKVIQGTTLALLFVFICATTFAQKRALESITENELKAHLEFIASDLMQGRDFGTTIPGLQITAGYLKSQSLKMGLKPGISGYAQTVNMISVQNDNENTSFLLKNEKGEELFASKDILTFPGSVQNDTINAKIVFAGYGFQNEKIGYNDLEGIDLKDKLVMIMTRNREMVMGTGQTADNTNMEMIKLGRIFMAGAKGIIFVPDPLNYENKWFEMVREFAASGNYFLEGENSKELPVNIILANEAIADAVLRETGKSLLEIQKGINETGKPQSFELMNVTAEIQIVKKTEKISGENIIAVVEGSDPVLKNECVVLTAHYDHVGINSYGEISNGADDNGSGTVALLEIAEAFTKLKKKPGRSVVFAWVTAEEKGLLGSEFYTLNPVFPLEKTVANINLDMVGRVADKEPEKTDNFEKNLAGRNGVYIITGRENSGLTNIIQKASERLQLVPDNMLSEVFLNGSDHFNFHKKGVPVIGISTGLHEDYHTPADDFDKIDYPKMKRVAGLAFLVAYEIANRKKGLQ